MSEKLKHEWECGYCGHNIPFRTPELPGNDPRSEMNEDKTCPICRRDMYWGEEEPYE